MTDNTRLDSKAFREVDRTREFYVHFYAVEYSKMYLKLVRQQDRSVEKATQAASMFAASVGLTDGEWKEFISLVAEKVNEAIK